jgi:26S proteasome regulatory subunit N12
MLSAAASADFKNEVLTGNVQKALSKLEALKEALLDCDSLPPVAVHRPTAEAETAVAKEVLEYAVILSIKAGDKSSFQRYMASLRPYYTAARTLGVDLRSAANNDIVYTILGLNLLHLLVENRLADFHCEVGGVCVCPGCLRWVVPPDHPLPTPRLPPFICSWSF